MAELILTGASRGIGHALALALAARGERLVLVARDQARLEALVTTVEQRGGRAVVVPGVMKGRFDAARTPTGEDFSVLHPGVVRTELGAREGLVGWLLSLVKRGWEAPEVCAARLARLLARERWSPPGEARWLVEEDERPWPAAAEDETTRRAVRGAGHHRAAFLEGRGARTLGVPITGDIQAGCPGGSVQRNESTTNTPDDENSSTAIPGFDSGNFLSWPCASLATAQIGMVSPCGGLAS